MKTQTFKTDKKHSSTCKQPVMKEQLKRTALGFLLMIMTTATAVHAQNLNSPNKKGPMGIEVNTSTGNIFISRLDHHIPLRGFDIDLDFYYNSFDFDINKGFGKGWSSLFSSRYLKDTQNNIIITWGDGREDKYIPQGASFSTPAGIFSSLSQYQPGKYLVTNKKGTRYYFDNATHRKITKVDEPNGNFLTFQYTDSLLTTITSSTGLSVTLAYLPNGNLQSVTDATTTPVHTTNYSYDGNGNLIRVTDPLGGSTRYTYLVNGPMKTMTDKNSNTVDLIYFGDLSCRELIGCNKRLSFSYDTALMVTTCTDYIQNGDNQVTRYNYSRSGDAVWLSSLTSNCCGFNMTFGYDAQGNKTSETDANGNITRFTYDVNGNLTSMTNTLNETVHYTYSADFSKITSITDARGAVTTLQYDSHGNLLTLTEPGNHVFTGTYSTSGDLQSLTTPAGSTINYTYDANGHLSGISGPAGLRATLRHDTRGNLLSFTDARGNKDSLEFDVLNRFKKITDPLNHSKTYTYDSSGNITSMINALSQPTYIQYDASDRPVVLTDAAGHKSVISYDAMDNITAIRDAAGYTSRYSYDARNRLSAVVDVMGNTTNISYDLNGNMTGISLPQGENFQITYDALNRMKKVSDNTGVIREYTYDAAGNTVSFSNGTGSNVSLQYDNRNRVTQLTDFLGNTIQLGYGSGKQPISITDRNNRTRYIEYDSLNRIKSLTDNLGHTIQAAYDAVGNITGLTDQNNHTTTYSYDSLNRLKRTTFPDTKYSELSYDHEGNILTLRKTDGTVILFTYDAINRVVSKTLPDGQSTIFTYDSLNRVKTATNAAGTVTLSYDALNRVLSENFNGRTVTYSYNTQGRTQSTVYPDSTLIIKYFDTRNRLISVKSNNEVLAGFEYDANDNLTRTTYANGVTGTRQYDASGRITSATTGNGTIQQNSFSYDGENNKTATSRLNDPAKSEQFTYDNEYRITGYKKGPIGGSPVIQHTYSYDALGNRTAASLNGNNINYTVNNLNQITAASGTPGITYSYDNNGNLVYDGRFYKTYNAEGQLMKDSASPSLVIAYQYDAMNRRVSSSLNGNTTHYTYAGLNPVEQRDAAGNVQVKTYFGSYLMPVMHEKNGNRYFYHAGDMNSVEAITNSLGQISEKYEYDLYGNMTVYDSAGALLTASRKGTRHGFTGQLYDSTTSMNQFYFREYNPATGLFNERDLIGYADGMGMYQYVHNNPASGIDVWGLNECDGNVRSKKYGLGDWESVVQTYDFFSEISEFAYEKKFNLAAIEQRAKDLQRSVIKLTKTHDIYGAKQALQELEVVRGLRDKVSAGAKGLGAAGHMLDGADILIKSLKLNDVYNTPDATFNDKHIAWSDLALSVIGTSGPGKVYGVFDFLQEKAISGKNFTQATAYAGRFWGGYWGSGKISYADIDEKPAPDNHWRPTIVDCPQNGDSRGKRVHRYWLFDANGDSTLSEVVQSFDPNAIIGPDGEPDKAWVSVHDRMPYTILYENAKAASAPAKFVKIISPIDPKHDPATFQLGSFGFNSLTFSIPENTPAYSKRLDCRDSLGLYVDITAGYDVVNNQAFWEFQSIDPVTLLPPADPLKGFLLTQDSTEITHGHGFVNFSIKPLQTDVTLDTTSAHADIMFDQNDTIPTNRAKNTIDAFAPTTHLNNLPATSNTTVHLVWSGTDDLHGCGIKYYTLYASTDGINFNIIRSNITRTDTTLTGAQNTTYFYFVLGTDSVGNTEQLRPGEVKYTFFAITLPVTWLYFRGTNQGNDNFLEWAAGSEQNTREYQVERSLNGIQFSTIGTKAAAGNNNSTSNYTYTDKNVDRLGSNVMYYRIKQVDRDARTNYTNIVRLTIRQNGTQKTIIYPNPSQGIITISVGDPALIGTMASIYDLNGKLVASYKISATSQSMDCSRLPNGTYLIRLQNQETLKLVKQ